MLRHATGFADRRLHPARSEFSHVSQYRNESLFSLGYV